MKVAKNLPIFKALGVTRCNEAVPGGNFQPCSHVRKTLEEIGCDAESLMEPPGESVIAAFYAAEAVDRPESTLAASK